MQLSAQDIKPLSSPYLNEGRSQERWRVHGVDIDGPRLRAQVAMESVYVSATDDGGFHLSVFATQEFVSDLLIVYLHAWAGYKRKTREVWMLESSVRSRYAIRSRDRIQVDMQVASIRKMGEKVLCTADFRVTDERGGLFELRLKVMLA
jgi:hypothetical protein